MAGLTKAEKARRAALAQAHDVASIEAPAIGGKPMVSEHSRTVVVVCKMPRGLYLQLTEMISQDQRVMGGGIEKRQVAMRVGEQIRLKPTVLPYGMIPNYPIVCGFSLTRDIDANFWRKYLEQNQNFTMITEGLLAAFDTEQDAVAYCREFEKKSHGLEPIAQEGDPRVEMSTNPNVSDIEIDTDAPPARKTKAA